MIDLAAEQARIYEALRQSSARCFLHIDQSDDALWVSDLPRRCTELDAAKRALDQMGAVYWLDRGLWRLDWTAAVWQEKLTGMPAELPRFPKNERYHPAYALCRLWLLHPARIEPENLQPARRLLKLMLEPEDKLLRQIPSLHEEAAARLRFDQAPAYGAGRILAAWLNEKENER